jgi:CheY-like chemotaxis protein
LLTLGVANEVLDADDVACEPDASQGSYVAITIRDTGVGMSREVLDRAVDPFFTTKPEGIGTGLGLSQVFGFVKQSGGHMRIRSAPGAGTTVTLYIPKAAPREPTVRRSTGNSAPRGRGEVVLVVEDNADVREVTTALIEELGYSVLAAEGPAQALDLLRQHPVSLIFSDIVMPGPITARQMVERAAILCPGVRVLFTSGYAEMAVAETGSGQGPQLDLLSKPFRRDELARRLRRALSGDAA